MNPILNYIIRSFRFHHFCMQIDDIIIKYQSCLSSNRNENRIELNNPNYFQNLFIQLLNDKVKANENSVFEETMINLVKDCKKRRSAELNVRKYYLRGLK